MIDEFGYQSLDRDEANLFFRIVNYRYTQGSSMAITTNKGIASWPSVLADDDVLAGAILDRLLHSATVLNIQGRSYRLKELDEQLSQNASSHQSVDEPDVVAPSDEASAEKQAATSEVDSSATETWPAPTRLGSAKK